MFISMARSFRFSPLASFYRKMVNITIKLIWKPDFFDSLHGVSNVVMYDDSSK